MCDRRTAHIKSWPTGRSASDYGDHHEGAKYPSVVEDAERRGVLRPSGTIVEPISGNTGIGLAMVAAVKGYKLILVMPDSMSIERSRPMLAYGATFDLTPREKGMKGSIARAEENVASTPGACMPQQFENPTDVDMHVRRLKDSCRNSDRHLRRTSPFSRAAVPALGKSAVLNALCDVTLNRKSKLRAPRTAGSASRSTGSPLMARRNDIRLSLIPCAAALGTRVV
ncbi:Pyridoxal-phosphate dependent enzyme [Cupriavidus sp. YR651]|nr:Pyridoxal-phosphate dependent enzyme [Cupriavidus sp. YR651]